MNDDELRRWVERWSAEYRASGDAVLKPLAGKDAFSRDDLEVVYRWKFRRQWPKRKIDLMRKLPEQRIVELTRRAFACADELGALVILTLIPGARAAGASAILTARDLSATPSWTCGRSDR